VERNAEQLAWAVLLGAFGVFCLLVFAIPSGLNIYRARAMSDRPVRLDVIKGTTLLLPPGGRDEVSAPLRSTLSGGERIRTATDSEALLSFFDGSNVHLWPNTTVHVLAARSSTFGLANSEFVISQDGGHARYEVAIPETAARKFQVQTPQSQALLREGSYKLDVNPDAAVMSVSAGSATVSGLEGAVEVLRGELVRVTGQSQLSSPEPTEQNVVSNGDFTQDLTGWQPGQRDVGDGPAGSVDISEQDNRTFVEFARDQAQRHAETFIHKSINQDVTDSDELRFAFQVRILRQALSADGPIGSESPLLVRVHYRDSFGSEATWTRGVYIQDDDTPLPRDALVVPTDFWTDLTFDLFDPNVTSPRPAEILWIEFAASGRGYQSDLGHVQLLTN
jgi:hypothetical protein